MAPPIGALGCHQPTLLLLLLPSHDLLEAGVQENLKKAEKEKRKKNRSLLFCLSPLSWFSRQNQRAFLGTLFVDANTHFKILRCIGLSPGDIGGGEKSKFTTALCCFDIWSSLRPP